MKPKKHHINQKETHAKRAIHLTALDLPLCIATRIIIPDGVLSIAVVEKYTRILVYSEALRAWRLNRSTLLERAHVVKGGERSFATRSSNPEQNKKSFNLY